MSGFGEAVRRARIDRGLSQAELGEPLFSRSYVSLVETGRRAPSEDVVEHLARRLHLPPAVVRSWAMADGDTGTTRAALAQVALFTAVARRSHDETTRVARDLQEFALAAGQVDLWWTASVLEIDARIALEDGPGAAALADTLLHHWFSHSSPALRGQALTSLSVASRIMGRLDRAVEAATEALACLRSAPADPAVLVPALTAAAAAHGESGRMDEAFGLIDDLRQGAESTPNPVDAGKAFWTLGNLEFYRGDHTAGVRDHERAMRLIDPDHELRLWGRLHRSSASMRLTSGASLDAVPDLLAKAAAVFGISHARGDVAALHVVEGKYAVRVQDWPAARTALRAALDDTAHLSPQLGAEAHRHLGVALQALGEHEDAARHFAAALDVFAGRDTPDASARPRAVSDA